MCVCVVVLRHFGSRPLTAHASGGLTALGALEPPLAGGVEGLGPIRSTFQPRQLPAGALATTGAHARGRAADTELAALFDDLGRPGPVVDGMDGEAPDAILCRVGCGSTDGTTGQGVRVEAAARIARRACSVSRDAHAVGGGGGVGAPTGGARSYGGSLPARTCPGLGEARPGAPL